MVDLAVEVARLADVGERILEQAERERRERHAAQLAATHPSGGRRMDAAMFLEAIPGLAARFDRVVPAEFVAQTADGVLEVACPCGHAPTVTYGQFVSCECPRWFIYDGVHVHVAHADG